MANWRTDDEGQSLSELVENYFKLITVERRALNQNSFPQGFNGYVESSS